MTFMEEFVAYCDEYGAPERIELLLCDINAVLRGKWLPGEQAEKLAKGGVRLPMSTYAPNILGYEVEATGLGIVVGDPDGYMQPISGTLKPVPWQDGNVAQVLVELTDTEGKISSLSTREMLRGVLKRFEQKGLRPVTASELEFYVLQARETSRAEPAPPKLTPDAQNYDMELLQRKEPVLTEILDAAAAQGLDTDTLIAEYGPGQFEVNFHHTDDALAAADTALMFRRLVRGVVARHGLEATFMAKPYADLPGNGMHLHVSLIDEKDRNVFDGGGPLSETLKHAVGGVLDSMRDMQAIFAPHLNSYRRFGLGSFAPAGPEWGMDHRGAAVRLPEIAGPGARLEHRIAGADVNPYLVFAAILGGILDGLDHPRDLPPPLDTSDGSQAPPLASDWSTAVEQFAQSELAKEIFGENYRHVYTEVRRDEIKELASIITPVEYRYYLSRF
ncbi:glutamine synthetase family protein [Qingshengfaniella alkalisoli]|uniref:Glutamine synthetase n=1 Tax=Qingshengfaniella alkalisoli TaxID=2599296 RepID=A0A5B8IAL8_9RHOB|nr:glutamine synthetase family protein [Qingshengfaniella alkalisoli]QDY71565.1 glutamine synthetase [Qingshengfaniella alkalisoli]